MTEKRFTYVKNNSITQYQSVPIQEIGKGKALHCQGVVDKLNKLYNENKQLKDKYNEQSVEYEGLEEQVERLLNFKDNNFFITQMELLLKDNLMKLFAMNEYKKGISFSSMHVINFSIT